MSPTDGNSSLGQHFFGSSFRSLPPPPPQKKKKNPQGLTRTIHPTQTVVCVLTCFLSFFDGCQGLVIAFVSEFVPRLYYTLGEGNDNLEGFVNSTLSCFVVTEFSAKEAPSGTDVDVLWEKFSNNSCGLGEPTCRYVNRRCFRLRLRCAVLGFVIHTQNPLSSSDHFFFFFAESQFGLDIFDKQETWRGKIAHNEAKVKRIFRKKNFIQHTPFPPYHACVAYMLHTCQVPN